ncbi:hypothetical protein P152DRAFT_418319 [Eremomyces bilateralis CBS 781.70]|uniref:Protein NO VEIN C-terminal domain-containing protein n=1 Tax=Eremomyces bilateralis CBS 781.70 TaxID=1392243 RepID=A0A6G1G0Q7_9PEZI|nr:uncharacterized protein P152DRAFT_418319 [Eremomyces bilateralis CBS 781.70]KAF1811695.1 hypothetical protein P152DRAFT_418319 [Eremomyces bilateralis CBS 781.70]
MANSKLSDFYYELYGRSLAEPKNEEDVVNILSCIRVQHCVFDGDDETELQKMNSTVQKKMRMIASNSRENLARFTKAMSNELYDDQFRFFFELIQNADDATYAQNEDMPTMTFTVFPEELHVGINEIGFHLTDVLSICDTGQSSKKLDEESTGEKGFGFKAVFGVADQVHVQSCLWSFRFEHQRHQDGLGMITPIWEQRKPLPHGVQTRFRLRYSMSEEDSLEKFRHISTQLVALHPSLLFALRKLRKISINLTVEGLSRIITLEKSLSEDKKITRITSSVAGEEPDHFYLTFEEKVTDMPKQIERSQSVSIIKIGFPVTAQANGSPTIEPNGQFVFAYLPVMQMAQLPFLIQADFLLPGNRQSVKNNPWNRKLRDEIAALFASAVKDIVSKDNKLSYEWLAYIPQPMNGFWQPLQDLIHQHLSTQELFYSRAGTLHQSSMLRILPKQFEHHKDPLLPKLSGLWRFLSAKYSSSQISTLKSLGVKGLAYNEALELVNDDISSSSSITQKQPLEDRWHNSFLAFIQYALSHGTKSIWKDKIDQMPILPVRVKNKLEWRQPGPNVYLPTVVDEGTGLERIEIEMPRGIDLVVLHPDAAKDSSRREVYQLLGVRSCPPDTLCDAIEMAQTTSEDKLIRNFLSYFELLFWFSRELSIKARSNLVAGTSGGTFANSNGLFMRSDQPYHAECLLRLAENSEYNTYFLDEKYQASPVSTRSRGGKTWEQWLCDTAGVRWYPTLSDSTDGNKLHWMIETIRDKNSAAFVPMIQHHWVQEYSNTCRFNSNIKQALIKCKVLCQHGGFEELGKTWFPTPLIVKTARKYGVEKRLPILALPESTDDHLISQWPSLTELGVGSAPDLSFYRQALSLLSIAGEPPAIGVTEMGWLYKDIGDRVTLKDKPALKDEFKEGTLVWDPASSKWRTLDECVWKSHIPLMCKFILTSKYDQSAISGLFHIYLKTGDATIDCLIDELQFIKDAPSYGAGETLIDRALAIYALLKDMADTTKGKQSLRSIFKENALIYNSNSNSNKWLKSSSCIWHMTIEIGNHVPIAAMYPKLKEFFVNVLGVSTVTDVFMMKQLAAVAAKSFKNPDEIKRLMLSASELLDVSSQSSQFGTSIEILQQSKYLPCKSPSGQDMFRSMEETFFIADNKYYAEKFSGKLVMLDFAYEHLIFLHELFRILRLDDRYLARHVRRETSAETSTVDNALTREFRQCAYAISCCAISHRSPMFSNQNKQMYNDLATATVHTSADMSVKLVVGKDDTAVKVEWDKPSLIMKRDEAGLLITLPLARTERKQSMRSQLPGYLSGLLHIYDSRGERQIDRIINELESGTEEILLEEEISRVEWLAETSRSAPALESKTETPPQPQSLTRRSSNLVNGKTEGPPRHALPEIPNHAVEAPDYWKVLEHVHKQAESAGSDFRDVSSPATDDFTRYFASLTVHSTRFDPSDYPSLFGADFWLSKRRIGAAGELFVYELLRHLTSNTLDLQHWQSRIRHLVQAHNEYKYVSIWDKRETADIVYKDQRNLLGRTLQSKIIGDEFQDWWPDSLADLGEDEDQDCLEWLFEVKTSIGPCETDFIMSQDQYDLMRSLRKVKLGQIQIQTQQNETTPSPPDANRVYCIVRVYNLLSGQIGVRFFIDPWRFRDRRLKFEVTEKWKVRAIRI